VNTSDERTLVIDQLHVSVFGTREAMGETAARDVAARMQQLLQERETLRMVFAAAPSQNEFLYALRQEPDIDWGHVEAFHMDEYVGLAKDAPQRFGTFLREHLFGHVPLGRIAYIDGNAPAEAECQRYSALLNERPIDIVCAGIGENGHMAFNDPPVADFDDPLTIKPVTLDAVCRMQQVHDGAFATLDQVPLTALTMTMSALMAAERIYCIVPGATKTDAVQLTLQGAVSTECPATVRRRHPRSRLYLDLEAAASI